MKYDKYYLSRRTAVRGTLCLGLLAGYQLATAAKAHTPGSLIGVATADAKAPADAPHRVSPAAARAAPPTAAGGTARIAGPARPVTVRTAPHTTLREAGKKIALTFDDGPHPTQTPAILRVLRRYGTRATFFVIGENVRFHPDVLRAIAEDGHVVGNHSYTHPQYDLIPTRRVWTELGRTSDLVERLLGMPPRLARAPYGVWHPPSLEVCARLRMEPFQWDIDTLDWAAGRSEKGIESAVLGQAHAGAIVLAHDGGGNRWATVRALDYYLPRLLDQGYTLVQPL